MFVQGHQQLLVCGDDLTYHEGRLGMDLVGAVEWLVDPVGTIRRDAAEFSIRLPP